MKVNWLKKHFPMEIAVFNFFLNPIFVVSIVMDGNNFISLLKPAM